MVTTSSPLMLDAVDEVAFLEDGRIVAVGTHADLLADNPAYRDVGHPRVRRPLDSEQVASREQRMSTALPVADSADVRRYVGADHPPAPTPAVGRA